MTLSIIPAQSQEDLDQVRALFGECARSLDVDLSAQGFKAELGSLPGRYASPRGALFLARHGSGRPSAASACGRSIAPSPG
jgi:hypothetical protein